MLNTNSVASRLKSDAKLNIVIDDETWGKMNKQVFTISDDTHFRTFKYKINNKILYTNDKLYKSKVDTELCSFLYGN